MSDSDLPFSDVELAKLQAFVEYCEANPQILHHRKLKFFKKYIEDTQGKIPEQATPEKSSKPTFQSPPEPEPMEAEETEESEESEVELDTSGVIEPDVGEALFMGDTNAAVSEEDADKSDEKRREAMSAYSEGEFEKAVDIYTEAIRLNPGSAVLFVKRGQCLLQLNRPNACIKDCTKALEINPDSASAFKFRGRARRLLGQWEEAATDLRNACKIDFDEQADEWLREVTPNARKLEDHRRKYERKRAEKEMKEKLERARRAREEHARAAKESETGKESGDGGVGGGLGDFQKIFNDPEIKEAFQDPEVAAAFEDITANPVNIMKHQSNPKVAAVINMLAKKFGGGAGFPGAGAGFPGAGFPGAGGAGFPGFGGGFPPGSGFPPSGGASEEETGTDKADDVELD